MKASDAIARYLSAHGVTECFEMIGGMITHLVDSFAQHGGFTITSMHHEQAAAFAAEGVSRKSAGKRVGLALGTSGPGATNLITGIGSCWFDSVPCVFLTGQVNVSELKLDRTIRQQGFQELDIASVVGPITKYAKCVTRVEDILPELHRALTEAETGRLGPVLIDLPNNLQREEIDDDVVAKWVDTPLRCTDPVAIEQDRLDELVAMCHRSRRPLFVLGGGAKWAAGLDAFCAHLGSLGIPYVASLMGQERLTNTATYFGMIGSYGNRVANLAVQQADLLIVVGSRLDVRQTGSDVARFAENAEVVQIDIDIGQLNNRVKADLSIQADANQAIEALRSQHGLFPNLDMAWVDDLNSCLRRFPENEYSDWAISPSRLFHALEQVCRDACVDFVCDVGNHQMWAAHSLRLGPQQAIHHSGGMGAMGFALPAAIGIASISNGKTVVITGDGSLQVNIQELDTVRRLNANILILVLNNRSLGMVKNFQDTYFEGRNQSTKLGYSSPSFSRVAEAFGIQSYEVNKDSEILPVFTQAMSIDGPVLVEVILEYATECRPRLIFGKPIDSQYPLIEL